jgi:hypothetical protein
VFSELRKRLSTYSKPRALWFYRDKQQLEVICRTPNPFPIGQATKALNLMDLDAAIE